jgi:hypothetical protein
MARLLLFSGIMMQGEITLDLSESNGLWQILARENERLGLLFSDMRAAIGEGDRIGAAQLWNAVEDGLEALFSFEERCLVAALDDLSEELALRREHDEIRDLLGELGDDLAKDKIFDSRVQALEARLSHHLDRKRSGLYPWAAHRWIDGSTPAFRSAVSHELCRLVGG